MERKRTRFVMFVLKGENQHHQQDQQYIYTKKLSNKLNRIIVKYFVLPKTWHKIDEFAQNRQNISSIKACKPSPFHIIIAWNVRREHWCAFLCVFDLCLPPIFYWCYYVESLDRSINERLHLKKKKNFIVVTFLFIPSINFNVGGCCIRVGKKSHQTTD